jgi:hypothetical protein
MHIYHADPNLAQSAYGLGRHSDGETQFALRRKALLEVAATAPPSESNANAANAPAAIVPANVTPTSNTYEVSALRRQKGNLSILTQDGDKVQIRFRSNQGVALQTSATNDPDGSVSNTSVYAFASGRVQVAVEGELDTDELKAIGDLLEKVDALATEFFNGDTQAAFSTAAALGFDSSEIAGFALRLSVRETLRASAQIPAQAEPTPPEPTPIETTPADLPPAEPAPAVQPPEPVPSPEVASDTAPVESPSVSTAAPAVIAEAPVVSTTSPATDPLATLQQSLGDFLKQVLNSLASVNGSGRAEFSMRWKLQVLITAVESSPAAAASDPAGTKLATDSLANLQGQGLVATPVGERAVVNSDVHNA